ncbi:MAG: EF-P lysine aminoacylase GenX [Candidatus Magasanikbacteria bacterium]|nr:EF-P lysine aminoacylase GenX [Candidatus Magasanikbacteria bacterium]MBT5262840.1 EF-P lysine aminoacylase GenX [Candidatus Magasanikbacteria bacterium]MBT5820370.1 EF-P lysine aminoacylase GenX [Candidatus Magasanikbacteria bacterium]MBT6294785.1 EF-P lysine aminoacylase GenX [Candidatus Magasanikbacteria bacterium]
MHTFDQLAAHKNNLDLRWQIIKTIREFFWVQEFCEVDAPSLMRLPGQEPYLSPMTLTIHDENRKEYKRFLHTSPEFAMKKLLAAGYTNIFYLGKCFRDFESFGGNHYPEFTMLEWYRTETDYTNIMKDVEALFLVLAKKIQKDIPYFSSWNRVSMKELWQTHVGVNLDEHLTQDALFQLCVTKGFSPLKQESFEDLFYRIFLNYIEPELGKDDPTIVYEYPAQMAALAKLSDKDTRYAERFEVYVHGIEIANAFSELTNGKEQYDRFKKEQKTREKHKKPVYEIDSSFIDAVHNLPTCAGIALGVDRVVQLFTGCKDIQNVIVS